MKGRTDGMKNAVKQAEDDKSEYYDARAKSNSAANAKAGIEAARVQSAKDQKNSQSMANKDDEPSAAKQGGRAQSGSFSGGGQSQGLAW
jgi:hypothetical protein